MFGEHFQIRGVCITGKYILRVKKLKVDIFTHVLSWQNFPQVLISTYKTSYYHNPATLSGRGKLLLFPRTDNVIEVMSGI